MSRQTTVTLDITKSVSLLMWTLIFLLLFFTILLIYMVYRLLVIDERIRQGINSISNIRQQLATKEFGLSDRMNDFLSVACENPLIGRLPMCTRFQLMSEVED